MDHSERARQMYEAINSGDIAGFGALLADDFIDHEETPGLEPTREGAMAFFRMFRTAFPDMRMEPQDMLPSGDKVVIRMECTGTNLGEFMGMPATGKAISVDGIDIMRFGDDGLCHEHWGVFDAMSMMQQLGVVPGPQ
jgi:steroid delta-isomerase-like uncharacterized protein